MTSRFDLPPEVMPGERLPRPGEVKAKSLMGERWLPHPENKHLEVNERGQMRTCGPTPTAWLEDRRMQEADLDGPENEEDDPVDDEDICKNYTAGEFFANPTPTQLADSFLGLVTGMTQSWYIDTMEPLVASKLKADAMPRQAASARQVAQQIEAARRAMYSEPRFSIYRDGMYMQLALSEMTDSEFLSWHMAPASVGHEGVGAAEIQRRFPIAHCRF